MKPNFTLGYWRPWEKNSDLSKSYFDYVKDVGLASYTANTVGQYINQASQEHVSAINGLGRRLGYQLGALLGEQSETNNQLRLLNGNTRLLLDQQHLSNLLLDNIRNLLRVPDSEKQRQHAIEIGMKFYSNASKDEDLYSDALENLLEAEELMRQDYFVLHRLGMIYLHVPRHLDVEKALNYFQRAAKYAIVESNQGALRLINPLTSGFDAANSVSNEDVDAIRLIAAESYERAAFCHYILGQDEDALNNQRKAVSCNNLAFYRFMLAKYSARCELMDEAIENLEMAIELDEHMFGATFTEIDLIDQPKIITLLETMDSQLSANMKGLSQRYEKLPHKDVPEIVFKLSETNGTYEHRHHILVESKSSLEALQATVNKAQDYGRELVASFTAIKRVLETTKISITRHDGEEILRKATLYLASCQKLLPLNMFVPETRAVINDHIQRIETGISEFRKPEPAHEANLMMGYVDAAIEIASQLANGVTNADETEGVDENIKNQLFNIFQLLTVNDNRPSQTLSDLNLLCNNHLNMLVNADGKLVDSSAFLGLFFKSENQKQLAHAIEELRNIKIPKSQKNFTIGKTVLIELEEQFKELGTKYELAVPYVVIGNQVWSTENLNTAQFKDGTLIPEIQETDMWKSYGKPAYCAYENKPENRSKFGLLYNHAAVVDERGIAPDGWKVPEHEDFVELLKKLNPELKPESSKYSDGQLGKNSRKEKMRYEYYDFYHGTDDDSLIRAGFKPVSGGCRGAYDFVNPSWMYLWSSTKDSMLLMPEGWAMITDDYGFTKLSNHGTHFGMSVRLLRE